MSPERKDPDPKIYLFLAWYGRTLEADSTEASILQHLRELGLGAFDSPQALYSKLAADGFPVCPICGQTPIRESHKKEHQKPPRSTTDMPEAGGMSRRLPQAAAAIPTFLKILRHIRESELEVLRDEESWIGGNVDNDGVFIGKQFFTRYEGTYYPPPEYKWEHTEESWAELCQQHGVDPSKQDQLSVPERQRTFGGVTESPSDNLVALIAMAAFAPFLELQEVVKYLHPNPGNVNWDNIEEKREKLEKAAQHLAVLVRGGHVGKGRKYTTLSPHDQFLARPIAELHENGLSDEAIAERINEEFFRKFPEDSSHRMTTERVRRIRAFNLEELT